MRGIDRTGRPLLGSLLAITALVILGGAFPDDEKPTKVVPAAEAKDHVDERCTVEMTVRSSKAATPRKEYYLDSEEDFHDDKNFAVVISFDHAEAFQKAGVDNPADHYLHKKLCMTGKIIHQNDQIRMRVEDPKHIVVVDDNK
jgi:hypothetical protein